MTTDELRATLTRALTDEPYPLADVLCAHAHPEQRMTMTGFTTGHGFVVSCALCKASSFELAGDFAEGLAPTVAALIEAAEKRGAQRALTEAADALYLRLTSFPQRGQYIRARWALGWLRERAEEVVR